MQNYPMNSPLAYVGGKSKLSKTIIKYIPTHKTYCEVFAGAGWIFFRKNPSKYEVLNDKDSDLISFYRVLQNHFEEFCKQFKFLLTSREIYYNFKSEIDSKGLTDIQRAAKYYYLQRLAYGGRVKNRSFGAGAENIPRINLVRLEEELTEIYLRLAGVTIENEDWERIINIYDKPKTFFYLDPPYYSAPCYKYNFDKIDDYQKISDKLSTINGKFILSINDHPEIRDVFKTYEIKPVSLQYSISENKITEGKELLISNFEMEEGQMGLFGREFG